MNLSLRTGLLMLLALWLGGCAQLARQPEPTATGVQAAAEFLRRQADLETMTHWQLAGKLGIRSGDQAVSGYFNWQEAPEHYLVQVSGPVGGGSMQIEGRPGRVILRDSDGRSREAENVEMLLKSETGWWLPLSLLRYWIRGIPAPALPERHSLDPQGRISLLEQAGWKISYASYRQAGARELPEKIVLDTDHLHITLLLKAWQ
ncbi:MAG TPA: lipoprotein insertase outer membrane protein LolB [Pseudomonadales bacterium]|nr:lipoprotein insertase outer membrane protein LolB [Pseudomonadales bacterium]